MPLRRLVAGTGAVILALGGYVALDVADVVPGWLTRDVPATAPSPTVTVTSSGMPSAVAMPIPADPTPALATPTGPAPTRAGLTAALAGPLTAPALGAAVGIVVRDGSTGALLFDRDAATPRTPASTAKLLTAAALTRVVDPDLRLATRVVVDPKAPGHLFLVAGGDALLGAGASDPGAVEGRAGLDTLAGQVAASLGRGASVSLSLDTSFAAGPGYPTTWDPAFRAEGIAGVVTNLGLAAQLATPGTAAPADPAGEAAEAFVAALRRHGVTVSGDVEPGVAPRTATQLGMVQSAPFAEVLAVALQRSDNALTEAMARLAVAVSRGDLGASARVGQSSVGESATAGESAPAGDQTAAASAYGPGASDAATSTAGTGGTPVTLPPAGVPISFAQAVELVRSQAQSAGYSLDGVVLKDVCGLSAGSALPVRLLGDVLVAGTRGTDDPGLRRVIADLPVAGLSGTLAERFTGQAAGGAGVVRAKTGTLTGVSGLAGTVVDRTGRLLDFAVVASAVPADQGTLAARAALDDVAATLAGCGCTG